MCLQKTFFCGSVGEPNVELKGARTMREKGKREGEGGESNESRG